MQPRSRNSVEEVRVPNPRNINIQINFNMKDKPITGKKIDNFMPVKREGDKKHNDTKKIEEKTPEKLKMEERSHSKSNHGKSRKNMVKSLQNLKYVRQERSKSKSASPDKFHSSQKLQKTPKTVFTNSNIKNRLNKVASQPKSKEDPAKIKQFMQEKKRRQKADRIKDLRQQKIRKQRIQEELKKVEMERKMNINKVIAPLKPREDTDRIRMPIYFGDDEFDESDEYNRLNEQVTDLLHERAKVNTFIGSSKEEVVHRSLPRSKGKTREASHKRKCLLEEYLHNSLTGRQNEKFTGAIVKIQAFVRGYQERRRFISNLAEEHGRIASFKKQLEAKDRGYWRDQSSNSILQLESQRNSLKKNNFNSKFGTAAREEEAREDIFQTPSKTSIQSRQMPPNISQHILKELEIMKKQFQVLKEENQHLKMNIKLLNDTRGQKEMPSPEQNMTEIKMPKKIEMMQGLKKKAPLRIELAEEEDFSKTSLKKRLEAFECTSPSQMLNAASLQCVASPRTEQKLRDFRRRQNAIEQKFVKQMSICEKLLRDRLVSPRSYEMRQKQFEGEKIRNKGDLSSQIESLMSDAFKKRKSIQSPKLEKEDVKPQQKQDEHPQKQAEGRRSNSIGSYIPYFSGDMDQIHAATLALSRRIDEALQTESQSSDAKQDSSQYNSQGSSDQKADIASEAQRRHHHSKSVDEDEEQSENASAYKKLFANDCKDPAKEEIIKVQNLEKSLQNFSLDVHDSESMKKARQIFSKVQQLQLDNSQGQYEQQVQALAPAHPETEMEQSALIACLNPRPLSSEQEPKLRGFQTSLQFLRAFTISLSEYIRLDSQSSEKFIENISKPLELNSLQYLRSYRMTIRQQMGKDIEDYDNSYNLFQTDYLYPYFPSNQLITFITPELFANFLSDYARENEANLRWNDPLLKEQGIMLRQFYLVSIADVFNQALNDMRPGGKDGLRFPWLQTEKEFQNKVQSELKYDPTLHYSSSSSEQNPLEQQLDRIFGTVIAQLLKWGQQLLGFIPEAIINEENNSSVILNMNEESIMQVREGRLTMYLQKTLFEYEAVIVEYGTTYTEVLLSLGSKVFDMLVEEAALELTFWN